MTIDKRLTALESVQRAAIAEYEPTELDLYAYILQTDGKTAALSCLFDLFTYDKLCIAAPGVVAVGRMAWARDTDGLTALAEWLTASWAPAGSVLVPMLRSQSAELLALLDAGRVKVKEIRVGTPPTDGVVGYELWPTMGNAADMERTLALRGCIKAAMRAVNAQTGADWQFTPDGVPAFLRWHLANCED